MNVASKSPNRLTISFSKALSAKLGADNHGIHFVKDNNHNAVTFTSLVEKPNAASYHDQDNNLNSVVSLSTGANRTCSIYTEYDLRPGENIL